MSEKTDERVERLARVLIGVLHAKDGITQLRDEYLNSIAAELAQAVRDYYGIPEDAPKGPVRTLVAALRAVLTYDAGANIMAQELCPICGAAGGEHDDDCPIPTVEAALRAAGEELS